MHKLLANQYLLWVVFWLCLSHYGNSGQSFAASLQVVATVPELGSLAREIGGEDVSVQVIVKGTEDAHFIEARPSFIKWLSQADVYIQIGLELEAAWAPVLLQQARNAKILPGTLGYIDVSQVITPLGIPLGPVDRSQGDVHASGNPHFLLDPLEGLKVAALLRDRFSLLLPEQKSLFAARYEAFHQRLGAALVGAALAQKYAAEKLALLFEHGRLEGFLHSQGETARLEGWLGTLQPYSGIKVVADHDQWRYFARRFRLAILGFMEPKPGLPPTTRHLRQLAEIMHAQEARLIITSAYYDPRHATFLAKITEAAAVPLAHQAGSREGTAEYLQMVDYNVRQLVAAAAQR